MAEARNTTELPAATEALCGCRIKLGADEAELEPDPLTEAVKETAEKADPVCWAGREAPASKPFASRIEPPFRFKVESAVTVEATSLAPGV